MDVIAIIPARGGSKGVPGKNKALVDGKPLIAYTIETALQSTRLAQIIVSTDDKEILEIAASYQDVIVHKREADLATDSSPITDTIAVLSQQYPSDGIMVLQPTSPIRTAHDIDQSIQLLEEHKPANSVISVVPMDDIHPARMYWEKESFMESILPEFEQTRRQEIPVALYRNGSIYLVRTSAFKQHHKVMVKPSIGYQMPFSQLLNIDEPRDLMIAEVLIKAWKKGELK